MSSSLIDINSADALEQRTKEANAAKSVLLFGADWHEACPMLKMVLEALAATPDNGEILFGFVDAETASDLSDKFEVTMVPTILLLAGKSTRERLEGEVLADPSHVTLAVQRLATLVVEAPTASSSGESATSPAQDPKTTALNDRLERLILADTVMLFMKGTPEKPRCGFSRQAVELLRQEEIPFGSFDILSDSDVRQGLKTYSDWPTYPQIVSTKASLFERLNFLRKKKNCLDK